MVYFPVAYKNISVEALSESESPSLVSSQNT